MDKHIEVGKLVKVTGDTGDLGHYFIPGTVCVVRLFDSSDDTYFLRSSEVPTAGWWVHMDDVELVK